MFEKAAFCKDTRTNIPFLIESHTVQIIHFGEFESSTIELQSKGQEHAFTKRLSPERNKCFTMCFQWAGYFTSLFSIAT